MAFVSMEIAVTTFALSVGVMMVLMLTLPASKEQESMEEATSFCL